MADLSTEDVNVDVWQARDDGVGTSTEYNGRNYLCGVGACGLRMMEINTTIYPRSHADGDADGRCWMSNTICHPTII